LEHRVENAITAGLSRQIALVRALSVAANNIANQNTAGFKAERLQFQEYLAQVHAPGGDAAVSLVEDALSYADFSAGGLMQTHAPLDFAINGEGFFAVQVGDEVRYTRNGRFTLNETGELVARDGARVLDSGGSAIILNAEDGAPALSADGVLQQKGAAVAALGVFQFADSRVLVRAGDNRFAALNEPAPVVAPRVSQGFVEASNVVAVSAMTDLMEIMRAYEQAAQAVALADELARNTVRTLSERA
jgi:flagellar basal-body rod protein FlgF